MADSRPEASSLSPTLGRRLRRGRGKHTRSLRQPYGLHPVTRVSALLITGLDTREGEQAKNNINVRAVSVKRGLKGNENDEKEIFQIGGRRDRECCSLSVKR